MSEGNGRTLGLLPVRGGSRGLPGKNAMILGDKPLMGWPASILSASPFVDDAICSTDSEELAQIAERYGLVSRPLRPPELATSQSLVSETIRHVLSSRREAGIEYEYVVLVQATSPFVTLSDIHATVATLKNEKADSVLAVTAIPEDFHPSILCKIENGKLVVGGSDEEAFIRRQDRTPWFRRVGNFIGVRVSFFEQTNQFIGGETALIEIGNERAVNIDTMDDFLFANDLLARLDT